MIRKFNLVVTAYIRGRRIRRQASVGISARLRRARLRRNTKRRCSISSVAKLLSEHRLVACAASGFVTRWFTEFRGAYLFLQRSATPLGAQATSLCSESNLAT